MFRKKWKPNASQRAEFRERMEALKEAVTERVPPEYSIPCSGDCVKGDSIAFFHPNKASERMYGVITAESYGAEKQQHTFTIELLHGGKTMIKGRNLYDNPVFRKPWNDEDERTKAQTEKHQRGDRARADRATRKANKDSLD